MPLPPTPDDSAQAAILESARAANGLAVAFGEAARPETLDVSLPSIVGSLASDLERRLRALAAEVPQVAPLCEAAAVCGDLATLAACNAGALESPAPAADAVRTARETIRRLEELVPEGSEDFARRDVLGAGWKASLAARQVRDLQA